MSRKETITILFVALAGFLAVQFLMGQSGTTPGTTPGTGTGTTVAATELYIRATLNGKNEVPAVITDGKGEFRGTINAAGTEIAYELEYSGLSGAASMAHIHLGQKFANGGVMVWICTAGAPAPTGTPVCPAGNAGKVTGKWTKDSIVGPANQGIPFPSPDMKKLLAALESGHSYVNIHTVMAPNGEIRGQVKPGKGPPEDDDDDDNGKGYGKGQGKGKGQGGD
jgi:hypothetical protein